MRIRLTVTHTEEAAPPQTYHYDRASVTIGRAPSNDLVLEDETRVVSKRHAMIRSDGRRLTLRDLGSKNHTFLNGDRIAPGVSYSLAAGADVMVGPFRVAAEIERATGGAGRWASFAPPGPNPFEQDARTLAKVVAGLRRTLRGDGAEHADDALDDALAAAFGTGGDAAWLAAGLREHRPAGDQTVAPGLRADPKK